MTMRMESDCPHGYSSTLVCMFCTKDRTYEMQRELLDYKTSTINVLRAQVADLDEQVAYLTKRIKELEGEADGSR